MNDSDEFVEVLATNNTAEIEVIKSILDSAHIRYYFVGRPLPKIFPTLNKPARLMVEKEKLEEAKALLKKGIK